MLSNSSEKTVTVRLDVSSSVGNLPLVEIRRAFEDTGAQVEEGKTFHYFGLIANFVLTVIIEAVSEVALEELLLKPMLSKVKEQWKRGAKNLLAAFPNKRLECKVLVHLQQEGLDIELSPISREALSKDPLEADEQVMGEVWRYIAKALSILRSNDRIETTKRIRIVPAGSTPLVLGYENGKPSFVCNIESGSIEVIHTDVSRILAYLWATHQRKVLKWQIGARKILGQISSLSDSDRSPTWAIWNYAKYGTIEG